MEHTDIDQIRMNKTMIPKPLRQYPLIKVCSPEQSPHDDHKDGKRPVTSSGDERPTEEIEHWVKKGGNYGVVARDSNDLIIFDSDCEEFTDIIYSTLPDTFSVESGGAGHGRHIYYRCIGVTQNTKWKDPEGSIRTGGEDGWFVVGPGSIHGKTHNEYLTLNNTNIAPITKGQLNKVTSQLNEIDQERHPDQKAGESSSGPVSEIDESEPLGFIRRDDIRSDIDRILSSSSTHDKLVWMVGWLHGAAGLTDREIIDLIMRNASWENLKEDIVRKQVESVIDSSTNSRGTHYKNFTEAETS